MSRNIIAITPLGSLALIALFGCAPSRPAIAPKPIAPNPVAHLSRPSGIISAASNPEVKHAEQLFQSGDVKSAKAIIDRLLIQPSLSDADKKYLQTQQSICAHALDPTLPDPHKPALTLTSASAPKPRRPDQADCGPRALVIALEKLGVRADVASLRKVAGTTGYGTNLEGLKKAAVATGARAEGVQMDNAALAKFDGVAIAWVDGDHYVAILGRKGDSFLIHDPNASKSEDIRLEELLRRSGGVALTLTKN